MTLEGKGYYIWQIPNCEGGVPGAIAARAVEAGLSHVLIKIADGPSWAYNYDYDSGVDLVPPVVAELRSAGVQVWGWHYVVGRDPLGEANLAVQRTRALGMDGYVIDAESEYKDRKKETAARKFMATLREGLPDIPIALSSYRYPKLHSDLPFAAFLEKCDYAMPQVYFEGSHNPEEQLDRCVEQYMALRPARPVIPTAPTYAHGGWRPTPNEVQRLLQRARDIGLTAANAWSWDYAGRPDHQDLFHAVSDFDWGDAPQATDITEHLIHRYNEHDASYVASLYAEKAAHVTGVRTVVGKAPIQEWYNILFNQLLPNARFTLTGRSGEGRTRHFTWMADCERGTVRNGTDVLGILDGAIQYHYSYFTIQS